MIQEISVYLPNSPGQFKMLLTPLSEANVNIRGFSVDMSGAYSQVRLLFNDVGKAIETLNESGYDYESTPVFALSMGDEPGQLLKIVDLLAAQGVNIQYGYVTLSPTPGEALVVLKTEDDTHAEQIFEEKGIKDNSKIPDPPKKK